MAEFYSEMAKMARDLLAPTSAGGLGQGVITLTRHTTTPNPNTWEDPISEETVTETLRGAVRGVSSRLVGSPIGDSQDVILASDRVAICEVPQMDYRAGDILSVDGVPVTVLSLDNIPAAGVRAAVRFLIRGG